MLEDAIDVLIPAAATVLGFDDILIVSIDKKDGVQLNDTKNSADE